MHRVPITPALTMAYRSSSMRQTQRASSLRNRISELRHGAKSMVTRPFASVQISSTRPQIHEGALFESRPEVARGGH
jgi:hypothetical protein